MAILCLNCARTFESQDSFDGHNCQSEIKSSTLKKNGTNNGKKFDCTKCGKTFSRKFDLERHKNSCNEGIRKTDITNCRQCQKSFASYRSRLKHEKVCKNKLTRKSENSKSKPVFTCCTCGDNFPSVKKLVEHQTFMQHNTAGTSDGKVEEKKRKLEHNEESSSKRLRCRKCLFTCNNHSELYRHRSVKHFQDDEKTSAFQPEPWYNLHNQPWILDDGRVNDALKETYQLHRHLILKPRKSGSSALLSRYNFPVTNDLTLDELTEQIQFIYDDSDKAFKVNLSFGLILVHIETGEYRYFTPFSNENLFDLPVLISNRADIRRYRARLSEMDVVNHVTRQRPDTKYKVVLLTNIMYHIYKTSFALGKSVELPNYILKNKSIISLHRCASTGRYFDDELCMFRCIAFHKKKSQCSEKLTKHLYSQWLDYVSENRLRSSDVTMTNIIHVEFCFQINVNVYSMNEDKTVDVLYKSRLLFPDESTNTMNLNLYEDHLSYIVNLACFSKKLQCRFCPTLFPTLFRLRRHEKGCGLSRKFKFPGGYFKPLKTVFQKLKEFGIEVSKDKIFFPYFAVFDMEVILVPLKTDERMERKQWNSIHIPICISICSNVPGFQKEKFILNSDIDCLLAETVKYLNEISDRSFELVRDHWGNVFEMLSYLESQWKPMSIEDIEEEHRHFTLANDHQNVTNGNDVNVFDDNNDDHDVGTSINHVVNHDYDVDNSENHDDNDDELVSDDDHDVDNHDDDDEDEEFIDDIKVTNNCEPPSYEFLKKISKENVWYKFLQNVEKNGKTGIEFNNWDDDSLQDNDTFSTNSSPSTSSSYSTETHVPADKITSSSRDKNIRCARWKQIEKMKKQFVKYCSQLPVLGFNSGKYDLNLVKTKLALHLEMYERLREKFVVKKNNNYVCLANEKLKFLDLMNFLPPGTSYDAFLKTFKVSAKKFFFPYEYISDKSKLEETTLPPKEAFYSNLKQCNTLENRVRVKFERLITNENKSEEEALKILNLDSIPSSSIDENYQYVQSVWVERNMKTLTDLLQYYSELDVGPLVTGIEIFKNFFEEKSLDVFKDFLSMPGLSRKMLYDAGLKHGACFSLIDKYDIDLYKLFMNNLTGGPSIVFTRHHRVDETFIRGNENKPCQSVYGYDSNSLYLYCMSAFNMPVGRYIRRKRANSFHPKIEVKRYFAMYDWMNWVSFSEGKQIRHKMNSGEELKVGPFYCDGYDPENNEIYEFLGDYFHGCPCINWKDPGLQEKYMKTMDRLEFLKEQGYKVRIIWECEYRAQLNENVEMREFVNKSQPEFFKSNPGSASELQIIDAILHDQLFGFIEVDIRTPHNWDESIQKPNTNLSPQEYYEEMSPLFCTTEIPFDSIGEHMKKYARDHQFSEKPRFALVGGLKAEKMLLLSPLLKWYVEHGLVVTKIHQVVEFSKMKCFKEFGDDITNARREATLNPDLHVIAVLNKLIGNMGYGGTIINKSKHKSIRYLKGIKKSCIAINNARFCEMEELDNEIFEVEFQKAELKIDNPCYLGVAILNYAKLHMLSFYYDFMDRYLDRSDFEYNHMDTDSAYFSLSKPSLEQAIKCEMLDLYRKNLYANCDDAYNPDVGGDVWFPRECCNRHHNYDCRKPGLMKKEFEATETTGLSSKAYVAKSLKSGQVKYSLKGANKTMVDPSESFERVLNNQSPLVTTNRGFAVYNNHIHTYTQQKNALSYFYCKRQVCDDGVHTKPLNIVLRPIDKVGNIR